LRSEKKNAGKNIILYYILLGQICNAVIPNLTSKITIVFVLVKVFHHLTNAKHLQGIRFLFAKKRKALISQTPLKEPKLSTL